MRTPRVALAMSFALASMALGGCGSGTPSVAPTITQQPANATTPLGQSATFSVIAVGTAPLQYSWTANGQAIPGADAATLTTAPVALSQEQTVFQVTVTNGAGQIVSATATLDVGPRSPMLGDLRFQQVDAPTTVNGYTGIESINFGANETDQWTNVLPEPMSIGPGCAGQGPTACFWWEEVDSPPAGVAGFSAFYGHGGTYAELTDGLAAMEMPQTVITGLNVNKDANAYGMSYMQETPNGNFDFVPYTVPVSGLAAAIAAEGAKSRVVTAITWNGDQVLFLSYGWTGDPATAYDTVAIPVTYANAGPMAEQLAGQGYIITACGGDNTVPNLWMVGTKVAGDSLPRPILAIGYDQSPEPLSLGGYATIGLFSQFGANNWWIGEK